MQAILGLGAESASGLRRSYLMGTYLKLSQSSKIVAMCLNLSLFYPTCQLPRHTHLKEPFMGTFTAGTTWPSPILVGQARSSCTARPAPACPLSSTRPSMPADPARQASHPCRPGPPCPLTRPAVPADPARHACQPCPSCLPTLPAKAAAKPPDPPSRANQPGHVHCFGRDAVDPASLVSSSFLLISAS